MDYCRILVFIGAITVFGAIFWYVFRQMDKLTSASKAITNEC
jgi:hypothetical protein